MVDTPFLFRAEAGDGKSWSLHSIDAAQFFGGRADGELDEHAAYRDVAWVRRCVELIANAVSTIPVRVSRDGGDDINWEFADALPALLWSTSASLQIYGASYWIRERNRFDHVRSYRWLAPRTMQLRTDPEQGLVGFTRNVPGREQIDLDVDDVVYIWQPSLQVEVGPGPGWVATALAPAMLAHNIDAYGRAFFERGAIGATVLSVEGNPPRDELDRLENWWKRLVGGNRKAFETAAVRASVKPIPVSYPTSELAMTELMASAREQIATAAGVPQTMLEDAANYATAIEHHQAFYSETVVPQAILIRDALNRQIFTPSQLRLDLDWQELDVFQEDEEARSTSLLRLVQAEMPLPLAMEVLGFDLPGGMTYEEFAASLETDRARRFGEQQTLARLRAGRAERAQAVPAVDTATAPQVATRALHEELDRWRRKSLSALKSGLSPDVTFASVVIGDDMHAALHVALAEAGDADEVRAAFDVQRRALDERVQPEGVDILPAPDEVRVTEEDIERAIAEWDRIMPETYRGLLDAEVED